MEQIFLANGFPKETVIAIIMLYKKMKAMVHSSEEDIVAGVLQKRDINIRFVYTLPRLHNSNIKRSNKRKMALC